MTAETAHTLDRYSALVLNADYRPLSYYPLSLWNWADAVRAVYRGSVRVIAEYDREIHSPSTTIKLPSVIALNDFVHTQKHPAFTRFNVFLRDKWTCQYCGEKYKTHELTFDHLIPRCRGGQTTWDNIVTACRSCNTHKGWRSVRESGLTLLSQPAQPNMFELQERGRAFPPSFLHESWQDFLYWDSELLG
jgi:5-methylcytosine-specific restriction endonuclease McrA